MNSIFILQILITVLVLYFSSWFYKHSVWLHYNDYIEIDEKKYPRIILFLINQFNKEGIFFYSLILLFVLPIALTGLFFCSLFVKGGYKEFEIFLYALNWYEQVLTLICVIFFYFLMKIWWDYNRRKLFLMPNFNKDLQRWESHKIKEIDTSKIQTYPRLTIYDLTENEDTNRKAIFDSISFSKTNKLINVYDKSIKSTLSIGKQITIDNIEYSILNLDVIFFSTFEFTIHSTEHKKIKEENAPNVPYNIQIVIELKRI